MFVNLYKHIIFQQMSIGRIASGLMINMKALILLGCRLYFKRWRIPRMSSIITMGRYIKSRFISGWSLLPDTFHSMCICFSKQENKVYNTTNCFRVCTMIGNLPFAFDIARNKVLPMYPTE